MDNHELKKAKEDIIREVDLIRRGKVSMGKKRKKSKNNNNEGDRGILQLFEGIIGGDPDNDEEYSCLVDLWMCRDEKGHPEEIHITLDNVSMHLPWIILPDLMMAFVEAHDKFHDYMHKKFPPTPPDTDTKPPSSPPPNGDVPKN